jgi:hypothetical protein
MIGVEEMKIEYKLHDEEVECVDLHITVKWEYEDEKLYTSDGDIGWDRTAYWEPIYIDWNDLSEHLRNEEQVFDALKEKILGVSSNGLVYKK